MKHFRSGQATRSSAEKNLGLEGFTLLEIAMTSVVLILLMGGIITSYVNIQSAFVQNQSTAILAERAQHALDRIVEVAGQALTTDAQFSTLKPSTGIDSHCLRFRAVSSLDPLTGSAVFNDNNVFYIYGPDGGDNPNNGLIIGRGIDLADIYLNGRGADNVLGTRDDDVNAMSNGIPYVELLLPDTFAPQNGAMLEIDVTPAPIGQLITFTLRVNVRSPDGNFLLAQDRVFTERVALRQ